MTSDTSSSSSYSSLTDTSLSTSSSSKTSSSTSSRSDSSSSSGSDLYEHAVFNWTDPANIGAGNVRIYHNGGNTNQLYPDYSTPVATVAAGVQTWTSGPLCAGVWVFGFRVYDGTNEEPNTSVLKAIRVGDDGNEISAPPMQPILQAAAIAFGKIQLAAFVIEKTKSTAAAKVKFFTNDGAGGEVDYETAIGGDYVNMVTAGPFLAAMLQSPEYGETLRKFGCIAYTSANVPSLKAVEVSITPEATPPNVPQSLTATTGRI